MKNKNPLETDPATRRVFFTTKEAREQFFDVLKGKFGTWKQFNTHFRIYKSKSERFRNGIVSIPHHTFAKFLSCLIEEEKSSFSKKTFEKEADWGRQKGGVATAKKHPDIFEKGREIANNNLRNKYHFDFEVKLDDDLCELIGAFIGDGFTNRYGNSYTIQFVGNATLDSEYMSERLYGIIKKISLDSNPLLFKKDNFIRLTVHAKEFYELLTKRFGLKAGKKVYSVTIPLEIMNSKERSHANACIRGIFDTDGTVFYDKRKSYKEPYIRMGLHMESKELIKQVHKLLNDQGIRSTVTADFKRLQINGVHECKKFVKEIGFSNSRNLNKIKRLLK